MSLRNVNLDQLDRGVFDVLVVGGGINGAVSAAALSAQGARVALIDQGDFAGATSQESSNLVWGGIKYLETGELALVRALCRSRNRLIASYPLSVREIRFFTTIERGFRRNRATLYLGAWLYWVMGNCFTRTPRWLTVRDLQREVPAIDATRGPGGIEYSDAFLINNDARFVFGFIRAALDRGASIANYVQSLGSQRDARGHWHTLARDAVSGRTLAIESRALINACGPGVDAVNRMNGIDTVHRHIFSKGVHLIVDRIGDSERVLTFFADDGRLFFIIPMGTKSCIGTTDTRVTDLPARVTDHDRRFILDNLNTRLTLGRPLTEADVIAERCGVRPLVVRKDIVIDNETEWTSLSRKHKVETDRARNHVSIFGGKITDCLNIGDEIIATAQALGLAPKASLPWHGEPPAEVRHEFFNRNGAMPRNETALSSEQESLATRLWRCYGVGASAILDSMAKDSRMAEVVIPGTSIVRGELHYIAHQEMVTQLDDFLRRRSGIALMLRRDQLACAGTMEACRILFGAAAQAKYDAYFRHSAAQAQFGTSP